MKIDYSLELINITKKFDNQNVVENLNLSILPGKVTCLLGPSGCGKSTTLRIAAGLETQDSGIVKINGNLISEPKVCHLPPEKRNIGFMFQDFALFPHLTVKKNIEFGITKNKNETFNNFSADKLLKKIGLDGFQQKYPHTLSGGEQQRVALARAISSIPMVMLMDEPFSGLDKRLRDEIRDETIEILRNEGVAVLIVTHEPEEAMNMADNIVLMRDGKIIQQGAPYNIYNKPTYT